MSELNALSIIHKEQQNGADYYTIKTGLGELSIMQHHALVDYVHDTLQAMTGKDPEILANSGIMSVEKTIAIPAAVFASLKDDQKKEFLEPIVNKLAAVHEYMQFFKEVIATHNGDNKDMASQYTSAVKEDPLKVKYDMIYRTPEIGCDNDKGVVKKKQIPILVDTINQLAGKKIASFDEWKNNQYWVGAVSIHEDDMPELLASPNREAIFEALAHPENIKKGYLSGITGAGKGAEKRGGWKALLGA